jgi:hypothetical protein
LFKATLGESQIQVDLSLSKFMPPVYDQGSVGDCVCNACSGIFDFARAKEGFPFVFPARLALYAWTRLLENNGDKGCLECDTGCFPQDCLTVMETKGVPPESIWSYGNWWISLAQKWQDMPTQDVVDAAAKELLLEAHQVAISDIPSALASGYPVEVAIALFNGIMTPEVAKTGVVPMPADGEQPIGYHDVVAVFCDTANNRYKIRNSWGTNWGDNGHFYLPFGYLEKYGQPGHIITKVQ